MLALLAALMLSSAHADPPPNVWPKGVPYPPEGIPRPDLPAVGETVDDTAAQGLKARPNTAVLAGRVVERGSGLPIAGGTITAVPVGADAPAYTATFAADGSFSLPLPAGAWHVTLEDIDHLSLEFEEDVADDERVDVEYRLDRGTWDTIVVYGEEHREEVTRRVITADELLMIPGSFGDPIRALQSLPGVARPATLEGDIVVRGAEGINTGTYIDEIPVPYLFHFFIGRSVVNPALIDDVEFYAGGMPSRFGDVTQAVVNARTLDTRPKPGIHGRVSADLLDFAASGEGRLGDKITWQAGYRVSWIGGVVGTAARVYAVLHGLGDFRPPYPTLSYEDHLARLAWEDGRDRVVFTALGARDAFILHPPKVDLDGDGHPDDIPLPDLPYDPYKFMASGFGRYQLRWDRKVDGREQTTWIAAGPDYQQSLLQGLGVLGDGIDFGRLSGASIVAKRQDRVLVGKDVVRFGADTTIGPVTVQDYSQIDANNVPATTKDVRVTVAGWGEYQKQLGDLWVAPGLRASVHSFNNQVHLEPEPRLTLREHLNTRWTGTAFIGRFSQVPPADRYALGIGNPLLTRMTAWQASVGVEGRWPSGLEVDGTIYGSTMDHLIVKDTRIEVQPDPNLGDGGVRGMESSVAVPYYREVHGYAYGLEGLIRVRPNGPFFGWAALSIGKSLRVDDQGVVRPGDYDLPISLTLVAARELPYKFRLSGKFRVTSGYPYTPQYGVYLSDEDHWHGLSGDENSERFPWYRQFDVRVDRTWTGERARYILYLDVFNALDTKNWMLATYTPNYTNLQPTIWIPIIPTFGLEVRY